MLTRPELAGSFGMAASTHWLASAAAMAMLERGGNAFDAAAAAAFTLHVVEPHLNGPGGEVPILFLEAGSDRPQVLCGQGTAPAAARPERFAEYGLDVIPGTGLLAATVPGAVGAWLTLLRDHGTRPLAEVLDFAIGYAASGHPIHASTVGTIRAVAELLRTRWPDSGAQWLPGGRPPGSAAWCAIPRWPPPTSASPPSARRYAAIANTASTRPSPPGSRVSSPTRSTRFCRTPAPDDTGRRHPGLLTGEDLAGWTPGYEQPVSLDWRGWSVYKPAAWSQGPVLLQQLGMLDALGELPPPGSAERVHRVVEVAKLAFADREAWYGDAPDVPLDGLLDPDYLARRAALVGPEAAVAAGLRPGSPGGRAPRLPEFLSSPDSLETGPAATDAMSAVERPGPQGEARGDTCHLDVVDRWGNLVSATPSGGWLQSSPLMPELGFPLGTRAQMFWLEQGLPNSLAPGKRPRTTLSPTLALSRDEAGAPNRAWAFGTPGGDQQDQWQLLLLLGHVVDGLDLQAAIEAPAWHTNDLPSSFAPRRRSPGQVVAERSLGAGCLEELRDRGHRVVEAEPWSLGRLSAVSRDAETGVLRAAANPRGAQGYAAGR